MLNEGSSLRRFTRMDCGLATGQSWSGTPATCVSHVSRTHPSSCPAASAVSQGPSELLVARARPVPPHLSFSHREHSLHSFRENRQMRNPDTATGTNLGPGPSCLPGGHLHVRRITETASKNSLLPLTGGQARGQETSSDHEGAPGPTRSPATAPAPAPPTHPPAGQQELPAIPSRKVGLTRLGRDAWGPPALGKGAHFTVPGGSIAGTREGGLEADPRETLDPQ